MVGICSCKKAEVGPATIFETVTAGRKFYNADMKCEFAGAKLIEKVEASEITQDEAINDCIQYAKKVKDQGTKESHMLSWMVLHLALGMCHKFKMKDKVFVRNIMKIILPFSRGMDAGIFFRDIMALGEEGQFLSAAEKELLEKAMYFMKIATGFKINMQDTDFARSVYGPLKTQLPQFAYYMDLPIGNPAYAIGTAPASTSGPLLTACENLKPHAVLTFIRYGASAHGEALGYILASLSHTKTLTDKTQVKVRDSPLELTKECLRYLLRSITHLKLRFDDQKVGETEHDSDVYYVSSNVEHFLDKDYYSQPNKLKQLCRVRIRQLIMDNDKLPDGIYVLPKPLITTHKRYLDLLS